MMYSLVFTFQFFHVHIMTSAQYLQHNVLHIHKHQYTTDYTFLRSNSAVPNSTHSALVSPSIGSLTTVKVISLRVQIMHKSVSYFTVMTHNGSMPLWVYIIVTHNGSMPQYAVLTCHHYCYHLMLTTSASLGLPQSWMLHMTRKHVLQART